MKNKESECLTPDCHCKPIARGVCHRCYYRLFQRVRRGNATWGGLIELGLCKKATRYEGLTTAVRRKNMQEYLDYKNSLPDKIAPNEVCTSYVI